MESILFIFALKILDRIKHIYFAFVGEINSHKFSYERL
jgi:hypothetical protein